MHTASTNVCVGGCTSTQQALTCVCVGGCTSTQQALMCVWGGVHAWLGPHALPIPPYLACLHVPCPPTWNACPCPAPYLACLHVHCPLPGMPARALPPYLTCLHMPCPPYLACLHVLREPREARQLLLVQAQHVAHGHGRVAGTQVTLAT